VVPGLAEDMVFGLWFSLSFSILFLYLRLDLFSGIDLKSR
jgi:hypothetical protein